MTTDSILYYYLLAEEPNDLYYALVDTVVIAESIQQVLTPAVGAIEVSFYDSMVISDVISIGSIGGGYADQVLISDRILIDRGLGYTGVIVVDYIGSVISLEGWIL